MRAKVEKQRGTNPSTFYGIFFRQFSHSEEKKIKKFTTQPLNHTTYQPIHDTGWCGANWKMGK